MIVVLRFFKFFLMLGIIWFFKLFIVMVDEFKFLLVVNGGYVVNG